MKKINKSVQAAGAAAVIILAAGCAETITAEYVMPPKAVSDIKAIDTMQIITDVKVTDNSQQTGDSTYLTGALNQRVAARFCQEGFFRTTDFVWGNPAGADQMAGVVLNPGNRHGYARHTTDPVAKRAKLYLTLDVNINSIRRKINKTYMLKDIPYKTVMVKLGKDKNKREIRRPTGVPDPARATVKKVIFPIDSFVITATGNLSVKLVNKNGATVYSKEFNGLATTHAAGNDKHVSLPTKSAVIMEMLVPAVETIIADLSPHKETITLEINKGGDEKGFLLMKAQAFTEVIRTLDELEKKSYADFENLGVAYEIIGDYNAALDSYENAIKIKPGAKIAKAGIRRIANILSAKAALRKMDAKKTDTQYKKSEFKQF